MKTMTEQEVREHWGETLASLAAEKEVLITSGDRVVARLLAGDTAEKETPRKRFDPEENRRWREEMWGEETFETLTPLMESREDPNLNPTLDAQALEQWRKDFAAGRVFDSTASLKLDRDSRSTR